jgi:hypothetical protein
MRVTWPGTPYECDDRRRAVGFDVQLVALEAVRAAEPLLGREHLRAGEVPAERLGDELGRLFPVGVRADRITHGGHEPGDVRLVLGDRDLGRHMRLASWASGVWKLGLRRSRNRIGPEMG